MEKFEVGEWGEWSSHGGGHYSATTTKQCVCVAVVPVGEFPMRVFENIGGWAIYSPQFDGGPRDHESYLFATKPGPRGGKRKLYCPRVSGLKKIAPPEDMQAEA